jgi:predicted DNA-binding transcriptional regulator AlpA
MTASPLPAEPAQALEGLWTWQQVLDIFDICERTLEEWIRRGGFPRPHKVGRRLFFRASEVRQYVEAAPRGGPVRRVQG